MANRRPRLIELVFQTKVLDAEKSRFERATKMLARGQPRFAAAAVDLLEKLWYGRAINGPRHAGGRNRFALNSRVLTKMRILRAQGMRRREVVSQIRKELETGALLPNESKAGLAVRTLQRRYIPVVFRGRSISKRRKTILRIRVER
jgi:hypothetical protein